MVLEQKCKLKVAEEYLLEEETKAANNLLENNFSRRNTDA